MKHHIRTSQFSAASRSGARRPSSNILGRHLDSRRTDELLPLESLPLVANCDAPPSDSDNESVAADVEDPFADVTHGEALDTSGPSCVDEVHHISVSSGVAYHVAETVADVVEVVAS